jgi:hypothetical protein
MKERINFFGGMGLFFRDGGSIFEHIAHCGKNKQNND